MKAIIAAVRAGIGYVRAGDFADRADFWQAREHMQRAFKAAGSKANRASFFEFFLRAAGIEKALGENSLALAYLAEAAQRIQQNKWLSEMDRQYLLDFCDVSQAEIKDRPIEGLRLDRANHDRVRARLRQYYPIVFAP